MSAIRFDKLTMDEVEKIEELTGLRMEQMMVKGEVPAAKTIRAFALIAMQRGAPSTTWEEVGGMSYSECIALLGEDDPTPKAGRTPGSSVARSRPATNSRRR